MVYWSRQPLLQPLASAPFSARHRAWRQTGKGHLLCASITKTEGAPTCQQSLPKALAFRPGDGSSEQCASRRRGRSSAPSGVPVELSLGSRLPFRPGDGSSGQRGTTRRGRPAAVQALSGHAEARHASSVFVPSTVFIRRSRSNSGSSSGARGSSRRARSLSRHSSRSSSRDSGSTWTGSGTSRCPVAASSMPRLPAVRRAQPTRKQQQSRGGHVGRPRSLHPLAAASATLLQPAAATTLDAEQGGTDGVSLLTAKQERHLAELVQQLLQLEGTRKVLGQALGRPPQLEEWAAEAGLSTEELVAAREHGAQARELLLSCNMGLVGLLARQQLGQGLQLEDMVSEGRLGLLRAVEKFDPARGFRLATYAGWWVRQAIQRAIAHKSRPVRLPTSHAAQLRKVKQAKQELQLRLWRRPTQEELAVHSGLTLARLRLLLQCQKNCAAKVAPIVPWDDLALVSQDPQRCLPEAERDLEEDAEQEPAYVASLASTAADLNSVLLCLTERENTILRLMYGLDDQVERPRAEVAKVLKVSPTRVGQLERRALDKMRRRLNEEF